MHTVGLLIETSRSYGRRLLPGIAQFARVCNDWTVLFEERTLESPLPPWLTDGRCDGVIARVDIVEHAKVFRHIQVPVVDLYGRPHNFSTIPQIICNDTIVSDLAAQHLVERGLRHFAFCGFAAHIYSERRKIAFVSNLRQANRDVYVYDSVLPMHEDKVFAALTAPEQLQLDQWLAGLPKPVGIMACNDIRGWEILAACRNCGIKVPDEVAVVGVDNDLLLCELSNPPMTSVNLAVERIGYKGAEMLAMMMDGKPPSVSQTMVEPLGIVARNSTDVVAVEDIVVAAAMRYIREAVDKAIKVEDVLDHLAQDTALVSRRSLERRFAAAVGYSPKEAILNARISRIKQLLQDTNFSLAKIADIVGLGSQEILIDSFRRHTGHNPSVFRQSLKIR